MTVAPKRFALVALFAALAVMAGPQQSGAAPFLLLERPSLVVPVVRLGGVCRLIPFDSVYFEPEGRRRGLALNVGGPRPFANMDVMLDHRIGKNGDWVVEVVGCRKNILVLPVPTPYVVSVPVSHVPSARYVRIVGANGSIRRRIPR